LDTIELFHTFSIIAVPREDNAQADALVVAAATLRPCEEMFQSKHKMEVIFRRSFLDNFEH
jgi:hypothetical protein